MILYNVTVGIDSIAENEWLQWMKREHVPKVLATGYFEGFRIFKVLSHEDEETVSYSIQYYSDSLNKVEQYLIHSAPALIEEHRLRYLDRHVAFRTLLEEV